MYFYVYTPSNQHFKAFLVSKFNSETSFLYQIFKGNSCNVIYLSMFYDFMSPPGGASRHFGGIAGTARVCLCMHTLITTSFATRKLLIGQS